MLFLSNFILVAPLFYFWNMVPLLMFSSSFLIINMNWNSVHYNYFSLYAADNSVSLFLLLLTTWTIFTSYFASLESKNQTKFSNKLFCLIVLWALLNTAFLVNSVLLFYLSFEAALMPIFLLILGWGYQPERLFAGLSMLFYTLTASLPLILLILTYTNNLYISKFSEIILSLGNSTISILLAMASTAGFLIKLPIYAFHLWLPRAHVEAPVEGSMALAAIMLKLGGYGMLKISPLLVSMNSWVFFLQALSLTGAAQISFLCLRQTDIKVLIAYSSVAHMGVALTATMTFKTWGLCGTVLAFLSHGFVSSSLFLGANLMAQLANSRNLLLTRGMLNVIPYFSASWFIFCLGNMGGPPTLNLFAEILMIISLVSMNMIFIPALAISMGLATAFTLFLYMSTQHGQHIFSANMGEPFPSYLMNNTFFHITPILLSTILIPFL